MIRNVFPSAEFMEFSAAQPMLDYLRDHKVDAIVTDYQLGTMDGIAMIRAIRETDSVTPIIMASGRDDICEKAQAAGVTTFLTFPEQRQLGEVLKRLLAIPANEI